MTRQRVFNLNEAITLIWENIALDKFIQWGVSQGMTRRYAIKTYHRLKDKFGSLLSPVMEDDTQHCKRCGYSWISKNGKIYDRCPNRKCRSPYWNKERKILKLS